MEWRDIRGISAYQISESGRVRRYQKARTRKADTILSGYITHGYLRYLLMGDKGQRIFIRANRLVCEAWHGPAPSALHDAAHWDGDRLNNHYSNLRWATKKENAADRDRHRRTARGERHYCAKLTADAVLNLRSIYSRGGNLAEIAKVLGVTRETAWAAAKGLTWKHL